MRSKDNKSSTNYIRALVALVLAWIVPGAGHAFVGRPWRGVIIFITIGVTFWAGIALGGVMTVDHQEQKWWFAAEMLTGVHGLVGWQRETQQLKKLAPTIRKEIEQEEDAINAVIRERRRDLAQDNAEMANLKVSLQTSASAQDRQMLQEEIDRRQSALDNTKAEIIRQHRKLYNLRNAHTVKLLAKQNLALVAPMATLARAYAGVAGLLNLMCVFDAMMLALIGTVVGKPREDAA